MKYIAKPNTWFKEGTECMLREYLYDIPECKRNDGTIQKASKCGIFDGIRICEDSLCEGGINRETGKPFHAVGEEYKKGEVCSYDEFEIIEN
jgi:hypothetical protein